MFSSIARDVLSLVSSVVCDSILAVLSAAVTVTVSNMPAALAELNTILLVVVIATIVLASVVVAVVVLISVVVAVVVLASVVVAVVV